MYKLEFTNLGEMPRFIRESRVVKVVVIDLLIPCVHCCIRESSRIRGGPERFEQVLSIPFGLGLVIVLKLVGLSKLVAKVLSEIGQRLVPFQIFGPVLFS